MSTDRDVEAIWTEIDRNTPEAFWDVATWVKGGNYVTGSLDVANRKAIGLHVLRMAATVTTPAPAARACPDDPADDHPTPTPSHATDAQAKEDT